MSEYKALCVRRGECIVCGEQATDTHMNQAHAAPVIAKAMKDYLDGLRRGDEDAFGYGAMKEPVLANIAKVSPAFVTGYREAVFAAERTMYGPCDRHEFDDDF